MISLLLPLVLVAGALGAVMRFVVGILFSSNTVFPWAVLIVNSVGSGVAGWMLALSVTNSVNPTVALVILTGLCGGLTTFSTWSVETIQLALDGKTRAAVKNVLFNLLAGLATCAGAYSATVWLLTP